LYSNLRATIDAAYERRAQITPQSTTPEVGNAVETAVELLDAQRESGKVGPGVRLPAVFEDEIEDLANPYPSMESH